MMKKMLAMLAVFATLAVLSAVSVSAASTDTVVIDKSKIDKGVVTVQYTPKITKTIKVQITKGETKYLYTIHNNEPTVMPLQMGAGSYKLSVLENVTGTSYKVIKSETFDVKEIKDSDLYTNSIQQINFNSKMKSIADFQKMLEKAATQTEKTKIVYDFITGNISYDNEKVKNLPTDYLPVNDTTYALKLGICYDYSSLFASILRNNGIQSKLVMGYRSDIEEYHAWNEIFLNDKWIIVDTTYDAAAKAYKMNYSMEKDREQFKTVKVY